MPNIAPELVLVRNEFYARSYDQIKQIVLLLLLISALLIGFLVHQKNSLAPKPRYLPTTPDGKLIFNPPVNQNHLILSKQTVNPDTGVIVGMPAPTQKYSDLEQFGDNALVLYWAYLAVSEMFDYDFVHYRSVIQEASKFFTPQGHQNFIDALISSKNLETVKVRNAVVIPKITGPIELLNTFLVEGHFAWELRVPIQLTYASATDQKPLVQQLVAKMSIGRVSTLTSPFYGLSIYRLNFEELIERQGT